MAEFLYSAWFIDESALPDEQNREWVACILINADSAQEAQSWGDTLARDRAARNPEEPFLRSFVDDEVSLPEPAAQWSVPRIEAGRLASDEEIGW
jgi:hypothetical protein